MPLSQRRTKTLYRACVRNFGTSYGSGYAVFVESPDLMLPVEVNRCPVQTLPFHSFAQTGPIMSRGLAHQDA